MPAWSAEPAGPLLGPKRSVVVDKFTSLGSFTAVYSDWDVGGGLAAMLMTALSQSERFVVIERSNVDRVIFEQQMKANKAVTADSGPQLGQVLGAQFVVIGSVTEFGLQDKGGGVNIGFLGMGNSPLGGLLGLRSTEGAVAMDLRIVDTSTSQVVQTIKVKEVISSTSVKAETSYRGMSMGGDRFKNTPLGEATRSAISKAVAEIVAVASRQPWQALVVDFDGKEMAINAGTVSGVKTGDRFAVERITNRLTDPATGEVLSIRRKTLGTLVIDSVEQKVAFGAFTASEGGAPSRNDLVVLASQ